MFQFFYFTTHSTTSVLSQAGQMGSCATHACTAYFILFIISDIITHHGQLAHTMAVSARQVTRVAADILCLAAVGIPILLLKYLAQPNIQGFFCSDDSLRYPYFDSTIPTKVNVSVSYGIPTVLIIIVNLSQTCLNKSSLSSVIRTIYQDITFFLFGVFTVQV